MSAAKCKSNAQAKAQRQLKLGDIVHVTFLDHYSRDSEQSPGLLTFEVFGRVVGLNKHLLEVAHWCSPGGAVCVNTEIHGIARAAIQKVRRLGR